MKNINLWDSNPPLYINGEEIPGITYYPAKERRGRGAVVILPGGGYTHRAKHEGEGYAIWLNELGLDAFVVAYRVNPYRHPAPLLDARRAIRYVRANADALAIDPQKIAVMGSSAGGHLAALTSAYKGTLPEEVGDSLDSIDPFPNAQILCYPVLDISGNVGSFINLLGDRVRNEHAALTPMYLVDSSAPPTFIWHTSEDKTVNVGGSYRYAGRLAELGVPCETHIFAIGRHGLGLANDEAHDLAYVRDWAHSLEKWLALYGYIEN